MNTNSGHGSNNNSSSGGGGGGSGNVRSAVSSSREMNR